VSVLVRQADGLLELVGQDSDLTEDRCGVEVDLFAQESVFFEFEEGGHGVVDAPSGRRNSGERTVVSAGYPRLAYDDILYVVDLLDFGVEVREAAHHALQKVAHGALARPPRGADARFARL
jgi:hypothetical protein